jgi:hypothetical protein
VTLWERIEYNYTQMENKVERIQEWKTDNV